MSITSAMFTGVSGLLANAEGINVIGNNLANVNTVGFKSGRMLFSDLLSANIGNSSQIGRGTQIQKVDNIFGQGSFETTEAVTDLAIQGNSFFAVMDPNATAPVNQNAAMLTRAGAFRLDSSLNLVNPDGYQVLDTQGNPIKFSDNAAGIAAANIAVTTAYTPLATAYNTQAGTINTAAGALVTAVAGGTAPEIAAAAAIQTAATDAQTAATAATVTPSAATIAAAQAAFATLTATTAANGAILATNFSADFTTFNTALTTANTANDTAMTTAATPITTAEALLGTANGLAFSKITSIDSSGLITYLGKDGITTNYYNASGQVGVAANAATSATVQRLAVVTVANPGGLDKAGGTLFKPTTASGITSAAFSLADNSANGSSEKIYTNSLEQSNVDMAGQFVKMILTQRAYSANSKTITTADEMTQEVLNLKR
ncbi:MAG: flagellar hook-basal body complex protein [Desulfuromonadaceae bacterium]|nr:flagellar hook-basal body complex protein [Desulfuromonadaceae bacterium]MDD2847119.1 flagellar hook-basal body complex protein [Desulfuromonadaceae bacterium]MDD4130063.1 flagellar hook-basal body complex protein [Desulfuromonadaceae bacterium]